MAHRIVMAAFRDRLADGFTGCPVADEGEILAPKDASGFLVLQFPFSRSEQATIGAPGANAFRERGGARFVLNLPRTAESIALGHLWAEEIATLFRAKRFAGVLTFAPSSPFVNDDNDVAGLYVLTFVVEYQFDVVG